MTRFWDGCSWLIGGTLEAFRDPAFYGIVLGVLVFGWAALGILWIGARLIFWWDDRGDPR